MPVARAAGPERQIGQLSITLVIDKDGKTVQRFEGFTKPEAIRVAVAKAQAS
jgi:hypothetical protein